MRCGWVYRIRGDGDGVGWSSRSFVLGWDSEFPLCSYVGHSQDNGLQACAQGLRYFVGEKLPGLGPFFGPIGLGPALCLSCLEAGSRAVPLGHVYPRRWLLAWATEAPLSSCLKAQLCLSLRGVARN